MCLSLHTFLSIIMKIGQGELRQACHYTLKHPPCKQFSPDTAFWSNVSPEFLDIGLKHHPSKDDELYLPPSNT